MAMTCTICVLSFCAPHSGTMNKWIRKGAFVVSILGVLFEKHIEKDHIQDNK